MARFEEPRDISISITQFFKVVINILEEVHVGVYSGHFTPDVLRWRDKVQRKQFSMPRVSCYTMFFWHLTIMSIFQ